MQADCIFHVFVSIEDGHEHVNESWRKVFFLADVTDF